MDSLSKYKDKGFSVYLEMGDAQLARPITQWVKDCAGLVQVPSSELADFQIWDWPAFEYHKQLGEPLPCELVVIEKDYLPYKEQAVLIHGAQFFTYPDEVDLLLLRLSTHIQRLTYVQALESLSVSDALTGLFNRRKFDQELDIAWRQGKRQKSQCSLLLIDVDFFKRFNDSYGHLAGDQCLRELAQVFQASAVRPHDVVARIGGEEFAVILPDTPLLGAQFVANQIIEAVFEKNILNDDTPLGRVSVSIGIACVLPNDTRNLSQWQKNADDALYNAKENGRNQAKWDASASKKLDAEIF
ncbi:hypothetical protein NBRC116188_17820 [Oceaniserpentilla sp. 4NH20-0058]|uniref:GGDEF domain-containing protein n=1 Tax=Oceaniserpentilla sp. 4NH20-0058 TaxID=3127660 RepID=UPI0031079D9D